MNYLRFNEFNCAKKSFMVIKLQIAVDNENAE